MHYHLYTVMVDADCCGVSRDAFLEAMTAQNIGVGRALPFIPEHPYYRERYGWRPDDFPMARRIGVQTVSLPLSPALNDADVDDVIEGVRRAVRA